MTYRINVNPNAREFVFAEGGDDTLSGQTEETAKATINACVDAINALIPPPSVADFSSINSPSAGSFAENVILPDGCSYYATGTSNEPLTGNAFELTNFSAVEMVTASTTAPNSTVFVIDGKSDLDLLLVDCVMDGTNSKGIHIFGAANDIFLNINRIRLNAQGCIGLHDENTALSVPEIYNIGNIVLDADNCTGVLYNPSQAASRAVYTGGHIGPTTTQAGLTGLDILSGDFRATINHIEAETAIHVANGATLDIAARFIEGDIVIDSGGILNCTIAQHTGTIINNGEINGDIAGEPFGGNFQNYIVISTEGIKLDTCFELKGRWDFDGRKVDVSSITGYYTKNKDTSSTVEGRFIYGNPFDSQDPNNGKIFFTGSDTKSVSGEHTIVFTPTAEPIPEDPLIFVRIEIKSSEKNLDAYAGTTIIYGVKS